MHAVPGARATRPATVMVVMVSAAVIAGAATVAPAQSGRNLERPGHWKVRYDDGAGADERRFVVMRPGWHVFAGPGGLLWDPGSFASGGYGVSGTIFLFPEGDPSQSGSTRLDSAYGLFLAGRNLDAATPAYVSFQIGNDRRFRVARHTGAQMQDLVPWTGHAGIAVMDESAEGPVENVLAVDVRDDTVVFYINDVRVAELPRAQLPLDGVIGLRAGAGLSLHVTEVAIGPNRRDG